MSLSPDTMLELMAFADGELDESDRERVEALLAKSSEARLVVETMRSTAVPQWLAGEMYDRSGADGIADAVMARIEASGATRDVAPPAKVVGIRSVRSSKGSRVQIVAGAVVAGLALAAGVTLYVSSTSSTSDVPKAPVASVGIPSVDVQPPPVTAAAAAQLPSQGVEVDDIDSPSRGFSVFEIPVRTLPGGAKAGSGPSSVVIMIDDDPGSK